MASLLLKKMIGRCPKGEKYSTITTTVIPVGGYRETAKLALNTKERLFHEAKVFAVWDKDVFDEVVITDEKIRKLYEGNKNMIFNLGCTPEIWMIEAIESGKVDHAIRESFRTEVKTIVFSEEYKRCLGDSPRKVAKSKMDVTMKKLVDASGDSYDVVLECLVDALVDNAYNDNDIKRIVMPMLSKIR